MKNKTLEIDKALVQLQDKVRQTNTEPQQEKPKKSQSKLPSINQEEALRTKKQSEEALRDLDKMQL